MRQHCPNIPCALIANKIDVDYSVTNQKFKFAEANGLPFYFVSAADGTNVVQIFEDVLRKGYEYKTNPPYSFANELEDFLKDDSWL
jgi:Rab-like protein 2